MEREKIVTRMKPLIQSFIELLNPAIDTEIELFNIVDDKFPSELVERFQELGLSEIPTLVDDNSIHELNLKVNQGDSFTNRNDDNEEMKFVNPGKVQYINYIASDGMENLIFYLSIEGFDDDIQDLYLTSPELSFLKYALDSLFQSCRKQLLTDIDTVDINLTDFLASVGRDFINHTINSVCKSKDKNLFNEFNIISTLNYEGNSINAKLLLVNESLINNNVKFIVRFHEVISYNEHRKMRKLLEMTDEDTCLVGDSNHIYGLGKLVNLHNIEQNHVLLIDFINRFEYDLKTIDIKNKLESNVDPRQERITWFYDEKIVAGIKYGNLTLVEKKLSKEKLRTSIGKVFDSHIPEVDRESKYSNIIKIIEGAYRQKYGTTLVITTADVAVNEVERLKTQSIKVNKIEIKDSLNLEETIERITNIDGALYLDIDGCCHAIGVILDGYAEEGKGDASRGARYNSAIRYESGNQVNGKCLIVVISEDGMVDLIPDSFKIEKEINSLSNQVKLYAEKKEFESALELIEKMIKLNPTRAETLFDHASVLNKMGNDKNKVIELLNQAITLKPDYWSAYYFRGHMYRQLSELNKSIKDYYKVIELNPKYKYVYVRLGNILGIIRRFEDSIIAYEKALNLDNELIGAYIGKAKAYIALEKYSTALEVINIAFTLSEMNSSVYATRGRIYLELGDYEQAIHDSQKALEINPNSKFALKSLIAIYNILLNSTQVENEKDNYQKHLNYYKGELKGLDNKED